ncbi:MAG: SRPBCC domain-containing protein [Chitinophagaceae bacterium]|nr:SRPBCC domain-containing protein [Chitinophagaceae bacterium]
MTINKETIFSKDLAAKKITVVREFNAPVEQVWKAWTESELLDKWWAPKPWKANTKTMNFREGGRWHYYMEGPDGSRHWCLLDYKSIVPNKYFVAEDAFCDENGVVNNDMPSMHWNNQFSPESGRTKVTVEISFAAQADLEKILEMGFKEGFTAAHGNLDELLAEG